MLYPLLASLLIPIVSSKSHPEILFCVFERTGELYNTAFDDPPRSIDCGNTTYCQKITANYVSTLGRTHILLRGCDGIQIPDSFKSPSCEKEGCYDIQDSIHEHYELCCCKGDQCNSSYSPFSFLFILSLLAFFLVR